MRDAVGKVLGRTLEGQVGLDESLDGPGLTEDEIDRPMIRGFRHDRCVPIEHRRRSPHPSLKTLRSGRVRVSIS